MSFNDVLEIESRDINLRKYDSSQNSKDDVGPSSTALRENISDLEKRVVEIQEILKRTDISGDLKSLSDALRKNTENIGALEKRVGKIEVLAQKVTEIDEVLKKNNTSGDLNSLSDALRKNTESIDVLEKRVGKIEVLSQKVTEIDEVLKKIDNSDDPNSFANSSNNSDSLSDALRKNTESVGALEKRVGKIEVLSQKVTEIDEALKKNTSGDLNSLSDALRKNTESVGVLEKRVGKIEVLSQKVTEIDEVLKKNTSGDLNSLSDALRKNTESVGVLEKRVGQIEVLSQKVTEIDEVLKKIDASGNRSTADSGINPLIKKTPIDSNRDDSSVCQRCHSTKLDGEWCSSCDPQYFIDNFSSWTSGNSDVNRFIQNTQRNASNKFNFLEWIPYKSLKDIKLIGSGGFGTIYSAKWIDGPRSKWLAETKEWGRYANVLVALKSITLKDYATLFDELQCYLTSNKNVLGRINTLRIYGMTQNPDEPENYMMVMLLADDGDLNKYITKKFSELTYFKKLEILFDIITGLLQIHETGLVHRDLHRGNVLCQRFVKLDEGRDEYRFVIGDLGPKEIPDIPRSYDILMKKCWEPKPDNRPSAREIYVTIGIWLQKLNFAQHTGISQEFLAADKKRLVELSLHSGESYRSKIYHTVKPKGFSPIAN
ncbi:18772_t:CDS:2, partial [Acaulospora morrowiae]